jgi:hypothetical protein
VNGRIVSGLPRSLSLQLDNVTNKEDGVRAVCYMCKHYTGFDVHSVC